MRASPELKEARPEQYRQPRAGLRPTSRHCRLPALLGLLATYLTHLFTLATHHGLVDLWNVRYPELVTQDHLQGLRNTTVAGPRHSTTRSQQAGP